MNSVKVSLSSDLKKIDIYPFSDWHIGDKHCDTKAIKDLVARVADIPNAYIICMGDLINNATKSSVSDSYSEVIPPDQQVKLVTSILEPVKDRILLMVGGNHEDRTFRESGIDLTDVVAYNLGLSDRYAKEAGLLFLRFGKGANYSGNRKMTYTIYVTHGAGSGRKEGGKINNCADMAMIVDADIYIHAHTHLPAVFKTGFFRPDYQRSSVASYDKLFINGSSKLSYGGYGEKKGFRPMSQADPVIHLYSGERFFTGEV